MRAPRLTSLTVASLALGLASALLLVSLGGLSGTPRNVELYLQLPEPLTPHSRHGGMSTLEDGISQLASVHTTALTYDSSAGVQLHDKHREGSCQDFGDRELAYLDRQHPHCGKHSAMSKFTFSRCHGNDFKAETTCRKHGNLISSNSHYYQTACQIGRTDKTEYLDRHHIQCPDGEVLSSWHLTQQGCPGYQWVRVEYKCREAETSPAVARDTSCQKLRNHHLQYLDRQAPTCEHNEVMTGFRLHSSGCHGNDMRFRFHCVQVLTPWSEYGREEKEQYRVKYEKYWEDYVKFHQEYSHLNFPNSPSGNRIKRKFEHAYKMYRHYQDKFNAVDNERQAIKYERLYRRFARIPTQDALARAYKQKYTHFHNLFLQAQGQLPEPPKLEYPPGTFLGPAVPNRTDPVYWATMWDDQIHDEHRKAVNEEPVKPKCGDDCVKNAHKILHGADESLDGILPADPDWGSFPKELVRDPNTRQAQIDAALGTETWDPLNNADYEERLTPDGKELAAQMGCQAGDAGCLRKMGVWPGEKPEKVKPGARMHDSDSAAELMHDAREHLGDLLPDDPDWDEYPKQVVEDRESKQAVLRDAQNIQTFNPLDNADIGIVEGGHAERNDFRYNLRTGTGCDLGEKECLEKFIAAHPVKKK